MKLEDLTIKDIREIQERLVWAEEDKKDGRKWFAKARNLRDEYGLTDKDVLDIVNRRVRLD